MGKNAQKNLLRYKMKREDNSLNAWNIWSIKDKELLNLIICRAGGETTIRIMDIILKEPKNKHQLSKMLHLDYNTIAHHINIIKNHDYITEERFEKSIYIYPSQKLFKSLEEYKLVKEYLKMKKHNKDE